jgi:Tol biopolymer transport system component
MRGAFASIGVVLLAGAAAAARGDNVSKVTLDLSSRAREHVDRTAEVLTKRAQLLGGRSVTVEHDGSQMTITFADAPNPEAISQSFGIVGRFSLREVPLKYLPQESTRPVTFKEGTRVYNEDGSFSNFKNLKDTSAQLVLSQSKEMYTNADLEPTAFPNLAASDGEEQWKIVIEFNGEATKRLAAYTATHTSYFLLVMMDNEIYAVPFIRAPLDTGVVTFEVAKDLEGTAAFAAAINSGPLPGEVTIKSKTLAEPVPDRSAEIRKALPPFTSQTGAHWGWARSADGSTLVYTKATTRTAATKAVSMLPTTDIFALDLAAGKEKRINDGSYPCEGALVSADGKTIAFLSLRDDTDGNGKIDYRDAYSIRLAREGMESEIVPAKSKPRTYVLAPDGKHLAWTSLRSDTNGDNRVDELDHAALFIQTLTEPQTAKAPSTPTQLQPTSSGQQLSEPQTAKAPSTPGQQQPTLSVQTVSGPEAVQVGDPKTCDQWPILFTRDGRSLLIASWSRDTNGDGSADKLDNYAFALVPLDSPSPKTIAPDKLASDFMLLLPNSPDMLFAIADKDTDGDGHITSRDKRSLFRVTPAGDTTRLTPEGAEVELADISSDGKSLIYWRISGEEAALVLSSTDGRDTRTIAPASTRIVSVGFDSASAKVAYTRAVLGTDENSSPTAYRIWGYDIASKDEALIRDGDDFPLFVSYLPDGKRILMADIKSDLDGDERITVKDRPQLVVYDTESKKETVVVTDTYESELLAVSPDGGKLVVTMRDTDTNRDGRINTADQVQTYLIDLQGRKLLTLYQATGG